MATTTINQIMMQQAMANQLASNITASNQLNAAMQSQSLYQGSTIRPSGLGRLVRKKSRQMIAMIELSKLPGREINPEVRQYFKSITPDTLIHHLGYIRPVRNGRPHALAQHLLELAAGDCGGRYYLSVGLTYTVPFIPGQRKTRSRLTMAGLKLLEFWAEKSPGFRPFMAAYVTKKARKEVMSDTIDFEMGVVPARIQDILVRQKKAYADLQQKELMKIDDYIAMKQREYQAKKTEEESRKRYAAILQQSSTPLWQSLNLHSPTTALGVGSLTGGGNLSAAQSTTTSNIVGAKSYPNISAVQAAMPGMLIAYNHQSDTISVMDKVNGQSLRTIPADIFR